VEQDDRQRARQSKAHPDCRSTTIKLTVTQISLALSSRRDNHPLAATAEMAILIVAVFPSRLTRYTEAAERARRRVLIRKPIIYFAGKISKHGWRDQIVGAHAGNLDGACSPGADNPEQLFDPDYLINKGAYLYGGPFFVGCDHIGFEGQNNHGAYASYNKSALETRTHIFNVNFERVKQADFVFAYINELNCFGTLVEIGHAQAMGKRIVIGFGPKLKPEQLWMACERAIVFCGTPHEIWVSLCRTFLLDWIVKSNEMKAQGR
jgi:hypothetical protein